MPLVCTTGAECYHQDNKERVTSRKFYTGGKGKAETGVNMRKKTLKEYASAQRYEKRRIRQKSYSITTHGQYLPGGSHDGIWPAFALYNRNSGGHFATSTTDSRMVQGQRPGQPLQPPKEKTSTRHHTHDDAAWPRAKQRSFRFPTSTIAATRPSHGSRNSGAPQQRRETTAEGIGTHSQRSRTVSDLKAKHEVRPSRLRRSSANPTRGCEIAAVTLTLPRANGAKARTSRPSR